MSCRTDLRMDFVATASIEQTVAEESLSSVISPGLRLRDPLAVTGAISVPLSSPQTPCTA
jgi:hypothetical protein